MQTCGSGFCQCVRNTLGSYSYILVIGCRGNQSFLFFFFRNGCVCVGGWLGSATWKGFLFWKDFCLVWWWWLGWNLSWSFEADINNVSLLFDWISFFSLEGRGGGGTLLSVSLYPILVLVLTLVLVLVLVLVWFQILGFGFLLFLLFFGGGEGGGGKGPPSILFYFGFTRGNRKYGVESGTSKGKEG